MANSATSENRRAAVSRSPRRACIQRRLEHRPDDRRRHRHAIGPRERRAIRPPNERPLPLPCLEVSPGRPPGQADQFLAAEGPETQPARPGHQPTTVGTEEVARPFGRETADRDGSGDLRSNNALPATSQRPPGSKITSPLNPRRTIGDRDESGASRFQSHVSSSPTVATHRSSGLSSTLLLLFVWPRRRTGDWTGRPPPSPRPGKPRRRRRSGRGWLVGGLRADRHALGRLGSVSEDDRVVRWIVLRQVPRVGARRPNVRVASQVTSQRPVEVNAINLTVLA